MQAGREHSRMDRSRWTLGWRPAQGGAGSLGSHGGAEISNRFCSRDTGDRGTWVKDSFHSCDMRNRDIGTTEGRHGHDIGDSSTGVVDAPVSKTRELQTTAKAFTRRLKIVITTAKESMALCRDEGSRHSHFSRDEGAHPSVWNWLLGKQMERVVEMIIVLRLSDKMDIIFKYLVILLKIV